MKFPENQEHLTKYGTDWLDETNKPNKLNIHLIFSSDSSNTIGCSHQSTLTLPYCNKYDLERFKALTTHFPNSAVLMGRRTFESIGKILPNRLNIVLTTKMHYYIDESMENIEDVVLVKSVWYDQTEEQVFNLCREHNIEHLWIIGGANVLNYWSRFATDAFVTKFYGVYPFDKPSRYELTGFKEDKVSHVYKSSTSITTAYGVCVKPIGMQFKYLIKDVPTIVKETIWG